MVSRSVKIRFPNDLYDALQDYAKNNGKSVSATIISACERFLDLSKQGTYASCYTPDELAAMNRQEIRTSTTPDSIVFLQAQINELKEDALRQKEMMKQVIELSQRMAQHEEKLPDSEP
ncbi:MAG: hypothetical protein V1862_13345 [Methanobacteriota archaeon]